ncbi:MurT ligase domain-containing protein [Actinomycetaceae bacterium MB13-C1-2]|nr:MurT ligase domain-containing protein [Actinomycetaceae bacterium MB13-C1-2]
MTGDDLSVKRRLSARSRFARFAGRASASLSRSLGLGSGGMFGGKVALALSPDILSELAAGRQIVLVTGTNGKSTTTRMTAEALRTLGEVASNQNGDNMTTGVVTALMDAPDAPYAVLEVDEMHMPQIARATRPAAIVLLNLSRDQLDRVGEIGTVEGRLREAVELSPDALIVANCDDPLVSSAAWEAPDVQWVSVGAPWQADSTSFPRTGTIVQRDQEGWTVADYPEYARQEADWTITAPHPDGSFEILGPDGVKIRTTLQVPGRVNRGNAAQAAATATYFGVTPEALSDALASVAGVAGRYQTYGVDGRLARLILAKNPAGWQESLTMVDPDTAQLVISVNGQTPDGEDLSWLWDVEYERVNDLGVQTVVASGERVADLSVRLEYAGVKHRVEPDPVKAIRSLEPGRVEVLANYTAFRDLKWELEHL